MKIRSIFLNTSSVPGNSLQVFTDIISFDPHDSTESPNRFGKQVSLAWFPTKACLHAELRLVVSPLCTLWLHHTCLQPRPSRSPKRETWRNWRRGSSSHSAWNPGALAESVAYGTLLTTASWCVCGGVGCSERREGPGPGLSLVLS